MTNSLRKLEPAFQEMLRFKAELDARPSIEEIRALRVNRDQVLPADLGELREPLVRSFQARASSGDALRLPQLTRLSGSEMRGAIQRVLTAGEKVTQSTEKEERMLVVLRAIQTTLLEIQMRSQVQL